MAEVTHKLCTKCGQDKSLTEFHRKGQGWVSQCKACRSAYRHSNYAEKRERVAQQVKAYVGLHPDLPHRSYRAHALKKRYGLTLEDYDNLLEQQRGVCLICGRGERKRDARGRLYKLSVDHNHTTGIVRGLLCHDCNAALGMLGEDPKRMQAMIEYIERDQCLKLA